MRHGEGWGDLPPLVNVCPDCRHAPHDKKGCITCYLDPEGKPDPEPGPCAGPITTLVTEREQLNRMWEAGQ